MKKNQMYNDLKLFTEQHFKVLIEDYKAREQETVKLLELTHQAFYAGIYLGGLFLTATPFIMKYEFYILFGVFPIFLYFSVLTQMRYMWTVRATDEYLKNVLVPNLKKLLSSLGDECNQPYNNIMSWKTGGNITAYAQKWFDKPIEFSRVIFPLLFAVIFLALFILTDLKTITNLYFFDPSAAIDISRSFKFIILFINLISLIYVLIAVFRFHKNLHSFLKQSEYERTGT